MKLYAYKKSASGFSLPMVLVFTGISLMLLTGVLLWGSTNGWLTRRYNEYYETVRAAEASTEKVIAHMARDFQLQGYSGVESNIPNYPNLVPTYAESGVLNTYAFDNPTGPYNENYVVRLLDWQYTDLKWKYTGFQGNAASYRIISNARNNATGNNIIGAVRQDVQIASIPLFEFGVFYAIDLEVCPGADFQVSGRVHCNGNIYCHPGSGDSVTFTDHVTASGSILHDYHPGDGRVGILGNVTYQGEHDGGATSLNLPLGVPNTSANLHELIEIPESDDRATPLGQQRYYNKADLIIKVYDTNVVAHSGGYDNFFTPVSASVISNFANTTIEFYDRREQKTIKTTRIDIGSFASQQPSLNAILGRDVTNLYLADLRSTNSTTLRAILLRNAQTLPAGGLTVATMNPLYVEGHFNAPAAHLGTTNTSQTKPASLIADAITILSTDWDDGDPDRPLADPTTVNAAILAGIVPSNGGSYSGGLENFMRLLEDWVGRNSILTYNGSFVVLFQSQIATAPWSDDPNIYKLPTRAYSFDNNFKNPNKLPPGTPELRTLIRAEWAMIQPNATQ